MGNHVIKRMFRDLLSLHGYPLPFESVERVIGETEAPDYRRGYGNRGASARTFPGLGNGTGVSARAGECCAAGGCH
jgi:hypothetical protein